MMPWTQTLIVTMDENGRIDVRHYETGVAEHMQASQEGAIDEIHVPCQATSQVAVAVEDFLQAVMRVTDNLGRPMGAYVHRPPVLLPMAEAERNTIAPIRYLMDNSDGCVQAIHDQRIEQYPCRIIRGQLRGHKVTGELYRVRSVAYCTMLATVENRDHILSTWSTHYLEHCTNVVPEPTPEPDENLDNPYIEGPAPVTETEQHMADATRYAAQYLCESTPTESWAHTLRNVLKHVRVRGLDTKQGWEAFCTKLGEEGIPTFIDEDAEPPDVEQAPAPAPAPAPAAATDPSNPPAASYFKGWRGGLH